MPVKSKMTDQQPSTSKHQNVQPDQVHLGDKDKQNLKALLLQSNSGQSHVDVPSALIGDTVECDSDSNSNSSSPYDLPGELVSLILHYVTERQKTLYQCSLVNRQFHNQATPLLWKSPIFAIPAVSARFLAALHRGSPHRLAMLGRHIRQLCLDDHHWTDAQLVRLLPYIPFVEHLTITTDTLITEQGLQRVPSHCRHLVSLALHLVPATDVFFTAVGRYCHHLCHLDWHARGNQSLAWLALLSASCPLTHLRLTSTGPLPISAAAVDAIKRFDQLTSLQVADIFPHATQPLLMATAGEIDNGIHTAPVIYWPHLTHLVLNNCSELEDATLVSFIKIHPHIQYITLDQALLLTDTTINAMATGLPHLARVYIAYGTFISLTAVCRLVCQCLDLQLVQLFAICYVFPSEAQDFPVMQLHNTYHLDRHAMDVIRQCCANDPTLYN